MLVADQVDALRVDVVGQGNVAQDGNQLSHVTVPEFARRAGGGQHGDGAAVGRGVLEMQRPPEVPVKGDDEGVAEGIHVAPGHDHAVGQQRPVDRGVAGAQEGLPAWEDGGSAGLDAGQVLLDLAGAGGQVHVGPPAGGLRADGLQPAHLGQQGGGIPAGAPQLVAGEAHQLLVLGAEGAFGHCAHLLLGAHDGCALLAAAVGAQQVDHAEDQDHEGQDDEESEANSLWSLAHRRLPSMP